MNKCVEVKAKQQIRYEMKNRRGGEMKHEIKQEMRVEMKGNEFMNDMICRRRHPMFDDRA